MLAPGRSAAGYRRYTEADVDRTERIRSWRATGMGIDAIATLLREGAGTGPLERRLAEISDEMRRLREQQDVLLRVLGAAPPADTDAARIDKAGWTALLRAAGLDDAAMARWHALFEQQAPQAHARFLQSLGLAPGEIEHIRGWARRMGV